MLICNDGWEDDEGAIVPDTISIEFDTPIATTTRLERGNLLMMQVGYGDISSAQPTAVKAPSSAERIGSSVCPTISTEHTRPSRIPR